MKISVFGDLHLDSRTPGKRQDDYKETMFQRLRDGHDIAKERGHEGIVIAGDVFHRVSVPNSFVADVLSLFESFELPVFSVMGNHDLHHSNLNAKNKSPLYLLFKSGVVKDLTSDESKNWFVDRGVFLEAHHFQYDLELDEDKPKNLATPSILVGHQYIENVYDEVREMIDIETSNYSFTVMGHNHNPTVKELDDTTAIVPGAMSRLTTHEDVMDRDIFIWQIDFDEMSYEKIPLEIESSDVIFNQQALEEKAGRKDIEDFVNSLNENSTDQSFGNVTELLDTYDLDDDVRDKAEFYLREHGIIE